LIHSLRKKLPKIIIIIFLLFFYSAVSMEAPKIKANNVGDTEFCSITASYTVANGEIVINWSVNIKDKSITNYTVTLEQSDSAQTITLQTSPYRRPVPNPDSNVLFLISVNSPDIPAGGVGCVNQFQYLKGSTAGGGPVIPPPQSNPCTDQPIAFVTTYQNTTEIPSGEVGVEIIWEGSAPGLTYDDSGTIYQDGVVIANNVTTNYAPVAGNPDPNKFYYKVHFPHTESHSWYVTQKIKGCKKEVRSNTVRYDGTTGQVDQGGAEAAAPGAIGGTPQGYNTTDECEDKCTVGWWASHFTIGGAIENAICKMQCALINWEGEILSYMVKCVLMPALGLGYGSCHPSNTGNPSSPTGEGGGFSSGGGGGGGSSGAR